MTVGTPEVIELLETYLDLAKTQKWGSVAIALTGHPGVAAADYAGDINLERSTHEALERLRDRVAQAIRYRMPPPRDTSLDASYVYYPMSTAPLGYDYMVWLIEAEMTRIREGAPPPLKVAFWFGRDAEPRRHDSSDKQRMLWLDNVFRPMLAFIGAVEDEQAIYGRCKEIYVPRDIVAAVRAGEKLPRIRPCMPIVEHGKVTITLREFEHNTARNSNLGAWQAFAKMHCPDAIFVRDTAKADEPLPGFRTDPRAARDIDYRLALYEGAAVNLFVSNGPAGLGYFGSRPYLLFLNTNGKDTAEDWNSPEKIEIFHGIKFGEQWPWARSDQRIVWQADSYENIVTAWNETVAAIAA